MHIFHIFQQHKQEIAKLNILEMARKTSLALYASKQSVGQTWGLKHNTPTFKYVYSTFHIFPTPTSIYSISKTKSLSWQTQ